MTRAVETGLRVVWLLVLAALAHGPLLDGGHRAPDLALFERAAEAEMPKVRHIVRIDPHGSTLGGLAQGGLVRALGQPTPNSSTLPIRAATLALLLAAALGLGRFAWRLLAPWTDGGHARAAGWTAGTLALVHPATGALVANPSAFGELIALALGVWTAALFLGSRQERRYGRTVGAFGLAFAMGFAGELAALLPFALAFAELVSARRARPRRERLRTATNTLLIFGAAVTPGLALWFDKNGASRFGVSFRELAAAPVGGLLDLAERLSTVALPANPLLGALVTLGAGGVIVLALQPAVVAARSAPRLWSRMLGWWFLLLVGTALYGLDVRVGPDAPTHAGVVAAAAFAFVLGPAVAATALAGKRRAALPGAIALVWTALAMHGAWAWRGAAELARDLSRDLAAAGERFGLDARLFALDVPTAVDGVLTLEGEVAALSPGQVDVTAMSADAFRMLAYQPEFAALRDERLVVVTPTELLPADAGVLREGSGRQALQLGPPSVSGGTRSWRGVGTWAPDVDTLGYETVLVRADLRTQVSEPRRVHWRASEPAVALGAMECIWIETGDEPVLAAHLGASMAWILGDRARRVWFEGGLVSIAEARLEPGPESFAPLAPTTDGADWLFPRATTPLTDASLQRGRYALSLLSLKDHAFVEIDVEPFGADLLKAPGAARLTAEMARPVAWRLEFRVEGVPLARVSGRRVGRDGTVEQGALAGPSD